MENNTVPGKGKATASLVLGIIGVVCWFFGYSAIASIILGIVGLILASGAKKDGFTEGTQKAGFILSLIALIGGAVFTIACVACAAVAGAAIQQAAESGELENALNELASSVN